MIVLDSSEYMRNGDYLPTRFTAQRDAASAVFMNKLQANPESTVGLMTMGGEVKTTFISDFSTFMAGIRDTKITGKLQLASSIQIAALALKHRQNKHQRQRIVVFLGSPIEDGERELVQLAKRMKKNNIAIDVVSFGQEADNEAKLDQFINTVNSNNNSHLLTVPPGPHVLADVVRQSPILKDGSSQPSSNAFADDDLGFDAADDPELALALRMSLEEERLRQRQQQQPPQKDEPEKDQSDKPSSTSDQHVEAQHPHESSPARDSEATPAVAEESQDVVMEHDSDQE